jgi:hypothetical protein
LYLLHIKSADKANEHSVVFAVLAIKKIKKTQSLYADSQLMPEPAPNLQTPSLL